MLRDAAAPVHEHFASTTLSRLRAGQIKELIDIHRRAPFGPHPDALARVLNFFRAQDTLGKYVIIALPRKSGYQLAKITGEREKGSVELEPGSYPTIDDAEHAVFVKRVQDAGLAAAAEPTA